MFRKLKTVKPEYLLIGLVLFAVILYFFYSCKEGFESESECTLAQLEAREKSPEKTLVLLYADWCGYCKKVHPDWMKAAKESNGKMLQRNVGNNEPATKEEHDENDAIMEKYKVNAFPTILVFQNGKAVPYNGKNTVEDFLEEVKVVNEVKVAPA